MTKIEEKYKSLALEIYELAIKDNNYIGSDTWRFFKNKVDDYCIDEGYRNVLVILTDGYIYHENSRINEGNRSSYLTSSTIRSKKLNQSNWRNNINENNFGFLPIADLDLSNLEILVLGINPNNADNPFEEDVIKLYWSNWFDSMNVKKYEIKNTDLPANVNNVINNFINN